MSQQFKASQEQDGSESYVLKFFATGRIVINAKKHRQEMLQTRIPALENLYEVKFKIKGAVQKNDTSSTNVKKTYRAVKPLYRRMIHQTQMLRKHIEQ